MPIYHYNASGLLTQSSAVATIALEVPLWEPSADDRRRDPGPAPEN